MEEEPREVTSGFVSKKSLREGKLASYARLGNVNPRLYGHKLSNMTRRRTSRTQRSCIFALSAIFWPCCDTSQRADQRLGTAGAAPPDGKNGRSNGYTAVALCDRRPSGPQPPMALREPHASGPRQPLAPPREPHPATRQPPAPPPRPAPSDPPTAYSTQSGRDQRSDGHISRLR